MRQLHAGELSVESWRLAAHIAQDVGEWTAREKERERDCVYVCARERLADKGVAGAVCACTHAKKQGVQRLTSLPASAKELLEYRSCIVIELILPSLHTPLPIWDAVLQS